jgi:Domain of unknown function (DUF4160)
LPYIKSLAGAAYAGDQAVWPLQAPDVFFQDDNPPHVHVKGAKGADFAAKIRISSGDLLAGEARARS